MATFNCDRCGALCIDVGMGYATGCEHHPSDNVPVVACGCGLLVGLHSQQGKTISAGGDCDRCISDRKQDVH